MTTVSPIPEGFGAVTPHLVVDGAAAAIEFYRQAFDARELSRMPQPGGEKLIHAVIDIGGSRLPNRLAPRWLTNRMMLSGAIVLR